MPVPVLSRSATDLAGSSVSRSNNRADLRGADANTSYVTVKVNGKSRFDIGMAGGLQEVATVANQLIEQERNTQ